MKLVHIVMKLKIGFILAVNDTDVQWYKPLSYGYIRSYLEYNLGNDVEISYLKSIENVSDFDIIGISSTSQCYDIAKEISISIKRMRNSIITIIGGHHISSLPQTFSKEFDIGIIGEGEVTFLEVVKSFLRHGITYSPDNLKNINGIIYHDGNRIIRNSRRMPVESLDVLPFPYRDIGDPVYFISSRGCPFNCSFCSSSAFWGKTRFFKAENVVKEIEYVIERLPDTKHIAIWDDLFIADRKRFRKFYDIIQEKKLSKKAAFSFSIRADLVDTELCNYLKNLGVTDVSFGAESGSNRILKLLNKNTTVEANQRAIDMLNSFGFKVGCSFIIGSPTETEDEVRSTYEFILRNIIDNKIEPAIPVNLMMPIPGTKMWDYAVNNGIVDPANIEWGRLSLFASYRHSNIKSFSEWVDLRRKNRSIYMAEESLPQERLYEIMDLYENIICKMERISNLKSVIFQLKTAAQEKDGFDQSRQLSVNMFRSMEKIRNYISRIFL